jgi:hypothetical protein
VQTGVLHEIVRDRIGCAVAFGRDGRHAIVVRQAEGHIGRQIAGEPVNPQAKPKRTCTYYPGFVVKEIDMGEVGAADMSITAIHGEAPKCERDITHEVNIDPETWSGYFKGAKGDFVFFDSGDGWNGGMPFAVFNGKTGRKLLSDTRKGDTYGAIEAADGTLTLRYRRVWLAPCSLMADAKGCWKKIVAVTSLAESARPDCAAAYHKEMERTPKFASDIPAMASMISYEVETRHAGGKLSITPRPGSVECWLPD